jgi:mercuric ion transport protein
VFFVLSEIFPVPRYNGTKNPAVNKSMNRKLLKTGILGTVIAALCCFTPALVILLGALGVSAWVGYLDIILFPILGLCLVIIVAAFFSNKDHSA